MYHHHTGGCRGGAFELVTATPAKEWKKSDRYMSSVAGYRYAGTVHGSTGLDRATSPLESTKYFSLLLPQLAIITGAGNVN